MKKYIKVILSLIFMIFVFSLSKTHAITGSTIFIGEPVILDSYDNIEITQIREEINEETSEIKSMQLFTNTSSKLLTKRASVKLEDDYYNYTINSLKIIINDIEISEITKEGNNYIFYFQILPNESKKIEVSYKTDNSLQNAKVIKYTMDSIKGKNVKLFQINVKLSKYDIPLVEKIWPGAYEFEKNTISTEYFDFTVNNLTSSFIIQKETYYNLKYGDNSENLSELDEYVLQHAKEFIDGNLPYYDTDKQKYYSWYYLENTLTQWALGREYDHNVDKINNTIKCLMSYCLILDAHDKNVLYITDDSDYVYTLFNYTNNNKYCLASLICNYYTKDAYNYGEYDNKSAVGKMVAINYYESEQGKELYVDKDTTNSEHSVMVPREFFVLTKRDEYSILRTKVANGAPLSEFNNGIKKVYVNSDIDGNKIDISEEEIIQFLNMVNVDLYIRIVLYDPSEQYPNVQAGYYTDASKEIAMKYLETNEKINKAKEYIKEIEEEKESWYQNLSDAEKQVRIAAWESTIEEYKKEYRKFDNEIIANNCKVPTIAHCVGKCELKDGKYVIDFNNSGDISGLNYIYGAVNSDAARKMLDENKANNDNIKNEIINKISNAKITVDTEEYKIKEKVNNEKTSNTNTQITNNMLNLIITNPIILGGIILVTIMFIFLIIYIIRGKRNGRK